MPCLRQFGSAEADVPIFWITWEGKSCGSVYQGRGRVAGTNANNLLRMYYSRTSPKQQWLGVPTSKEFSVRRGAHCHRIWQEEGWDRGKSKRNVNKGQCSARTRSLIGKRSCPSYLSLANYCELSQGR